MTCCHFDHFCTFVRFRSQVHRGQTHGQAKEDQALVKSMGQGG